MQLYKFTIICYFEADSTSYCYRYAEVHKSRIVYVKIRYSELCLNDIRCIDKVYFSLERCSACVSKSYYACKHRQIACVELSVARTFNKVLHNAVGTIIDKYGYLAVLYTKR